MNLRNDELEARQHGMDWWLLAGVVVLAAFGLMMVLSASGIMAEKFHGGKYYFFQRQLAYAGIGLVVMAAAARIPRHVFYAMKYPALLAVIVLILLTVATPLGVKVNGAARWIRLGPLSIQPLEFAKIALALYLAWFFGKKQDLAHTFSVGVVPPFAVTGILCGLLLLQPDFGGAAVLAMLLFLMCMAGGTRFVYLLGTLALACMGGWMLITHSAYRMRRLLAFLDPFKDALDTGYQLVQSLYALGSGGIWGVGLGYGKQKLFFLPEAHNDFIVAVVGEELGFLGVSIVFVLIGFILWRAFRVAMLQEEVQDRLTAYGMALILGLGALLNLAVVLGSAPPKGVPMPFLSYGGSNLICSFLCVGILLNLSRGEAR